MYLNHLEVLVKCGFLDPAPTVFDSVVGLWDLRICFSNKFPGDAVAGPEDHILKIIGFNILWFHSVTMKGQFHVA